MTRLAHTLRHAGVGAGDRVAGVLPNVPEAVDAMLSPEVGELPQRSLVMFGMHEDFELVTTSVRGVFPHV